MNTKLIVYFTFGDPQQDMLTPFITKQHNQVISVNNTAKWMPAQRST